jgi:hypothetical protein
MWKAFINYEKEEAWLNRMSAKGLAFSDYYMFRYKFTDCTPGEYVYRIEYLENLPGHPESQRYLRFMAENNVEHVSSWNRWVYFRKKAEDGQFEIYSDVGSKIAHNRRIMQLWIVLMFAQFLIGITQLYIGLDLVWEGTTEEATFHFALSAMTLCFGTILLVGWNSLRKKTKKLKLEKNLRE